MKIDEIQHTAHIYFLTLCTIYLIYLYLIIIFDIDNKSIVLGKKKYYIASINQ